MFIMNISGQDLGNMFSGYPRHTDFWKINMSNGATTLRVRLYVGLVKFSSENFD